MRLDLAERLRCPRPHAPTPLIVLASEVTGRNLVRGTAGCVTCRLEGRFVGGDLYIGDATVRCGGVSVTIAPRDAALLDRLQALLGLSEPGGVVMLLGAYAGHSIALTERVEVTVVSLDGTLDQLPFTDGTLRATALERSFPAHLAADLARCLSAGGRIVGAADVPLLPGIRELARDEREWVGERDSTSGIVGLQRRR
jgi:hypothetical protein